MLSGAFLFLPNFVSTVMKGLTTGFVPNVTTNLTTNILANIVPVAVRLTASPDLTATASVVVENPSGWAIALDKVEYFVMVPMVYLALLFCLAGIIWRIVSIVRAPAPPYSLKLYPEARKPGLKALADTFLMPQIRAHKPLFWINLMVFHIAIVLLILGHFDILPQINLVAADSRDMLGAGLVGLAFTLPLFYFLLRRFKSPTREITVPADYLLLILILFLALFGDMMSWGNSWTAHGFVMTKQDFAQYFNGLAHVTFADPKLVLPGSHYHIAVIHVLLANLFFFVLPFSKVVHAFFAMPINLLRRK